MGYAVLLEVRVGYAQVRRRESYRAGHQLALQLEETDLRSILVAHAPAEKGLTRDGQREVIRPGVPLPDPKRVFPRRAPDGKPHVLHAGSHSLPPRKLVEGSEDPRGSVDGIVARRYLHRLKSNGFDHFFTHDGFYDGWGGAVGTTPKEAQAIS